MCDVDIKWPAAFPGLKAVDQHLRCGICYEYLKTAMITSCSHNYCSVCIRKSLQYRTQCPSCFEETVETHLRNNRVLDELVEIFTELRDDLIHCIRVAGFRQSVAQKVGAGGLSKSSVPPGTPLRAPDASSTPYGILGSDRSPVIQPRNKTVQVQNVVAKNLNFEFDKRERNCNGDRIPQPSTSSAVEATATLSIDPSCTKEELTVKKDVLIPSIFSPKKTSRPKAPENKVACPVCAVEVPEVHINQHLDACLKTPIKPKKAVKREPLSKLVYNLMKDKQLRQKLKEAGLSTQGDYRTLVQRHSRFTLLYNAECDTLDPRPISEIIKQVEREEKEERETQVSAKNNVGLLRMCVDKKSDPKTIEEARNKYLKENKESFNHLIQSVKQRELKESLPKAPEEEGQSGCSENEEVMTSKHSSSVVSVHDSDPDSPGIVEVSDDDSIFEQATMAANVEAVYGDDTSVDGSVGSSSVSTVNGSVKDDDCTSNHSFSLLDNFDTDSMLDSGIRENGVNTTSWNEGSDEDEKNNRVSDNKVLDSQLEDPSYRPDTQDMLDCEDDDEEPLPRNLRNNRLHSSGSRLDVQKLGSVQKSSRKHVGGVVTTIDSKNSCNQQLVLKGKLSHSRMTDISNRQSANSSERIGSYLRTRRKRKVSFECESDEYLTKNPSGEEFLSGCQGDEVIPKFSEQQCSGKRILRQRNRK